MAVHLMIPQHVRAAFSSEEAFKHVTSFIDKNRVDNNLITSKDIMRRGYLSFLSAKFKRPVVSGMEHGIPVYYVVCDNDVEAVQLKLTHF